MPHTGLYNLGITRHGSKNQAILVFYMKDGHTDDNTHCIIVGDAKHQLEHCVEGRVVPSQACSYVKWLFGEVIGAAVRAVNMILAV